MGIGNAWARFLAAKGYDLVLVGRDEPRLHAIAGSLRGQHGIDVEVIRADLSNYEECSWIEQRLAWDERPIDLLVNNAGYGLNRAFMKNELVHEQAMFDVLTRAVMRLSYAAAAGMQQRGGGTIINVSSVASWWPQTTYGAAKSYVTAFSQSLNRELRRHNVRVMALCPGFTRTEFHERAAFDMGRVPKFLWLDADRLVRDAWRDLERGRTVSVPGAIYKTMRTVLRFYR